MASKDLNCQNTVVFEDGDTCSSIAVANNISIKTLDTANQNLFCDFLQPGSVRVLFSLTKYNNTYYVYRC